MVLENGGKNIRGKSADVLEILGVSYWTLFLLMLDLLLDLPYISSSLSLSSYSNLTQTFLQLFLLTNHIFYTLKGVKEIQGYEKGTTFFRFELM